MARRLRFIPHGGSLVEVTCRTVQGRFLLKPTDELRTLVIGILARARRLHPVRLHAFVFLSNHYHLLLSVEDARQLAGFMNYLNSNLAREAGRLYGWKEKFWGRRYQAIVISEEEAAQSDRLRYLLSHGCKEGLVSKPQQWPGAHCVSALLGERRLTGLWFDRTSEYAARVRGEEFSRLDFASIETVTLAPMPCWRDLSRYQQRARVGQVVKGIEIETTTRHARKGTQPAGVRAILSQRPHDRPRRLTRTRAPSFHAASKAVRRELVEAYDWFLAAYRDAAEKLRQGHLGGAFPEGCFPPGLPFVEWISELTPG